MLGSFSGQHMRLISGRIIALGQHYVFVVNKLHWPFRVGQAVALSPPGSGCPDLVRAVVCSSYRKYFAPFRLDNYRYIRPIASVDKSPFQRKTTPAFIRFENSRYAMQALISFLAFIFCDRYTTYLVSRRQLAGTDTFLALLLLEPPSCPPVWFELFLANGRRRPSINSERTDVCMHQYEFQHHFMQGFSWVESNFAGLVVSGCVRVTRPDP